jgi:hypothetical protein
LKYGSIEKVLSSGCVYSSGLPACEVSTGRVSFQFVKLTTWAGNVMPGSVAVVVGVAVVVAVVVGVVVVVVVVDVGVGVGVDVDVDVDVDVATGVVPRVAK